MIGNVTLLLTKPAEYNTKVPLKEGEAMYTFSGVEKMSRGEGKSTTTWYNVSYIVRSPAQQDMIEGLPKGAVLQFNDISVDMVKPYVKEDDNRSQNLYLRSRSFKVVSWGDKGAGTPPPVEPAQEVVKPPLSSPPAPMRSPASPSPSTSSPPLSTSVQTPVQEKEQGDVFEDPFA